MEMASNSSRIDPVVQKTSFQVEGQEIGVSPRQSSVKESSCGKDVIGTSIVDEGSVKRIVITIKDLVLWTTAQHVMEAIHECEDGQNVKVPFLKQAVVNNCDLKCESEKTENDKSPFKRKDVGASATNRQQTEGDSKHSPCASRSETMDAFTTYCHATEEVSKNSEAPDNVKVNVPATNCDKIQIVTENSGTLSSSENKSTNHCEKTEHISENNQKIAEENLDAVTMNKEPGKVLTEELKADVDRESDGPLEQVEEVRDENQTENCSEETRQRKKPGRKLNRRNSDAMQAANAIDSSSDCSVNSTTSSLSSSEMDSKSSGSRRKKMKSRKTRDAEHMPETTHSTNHGPNRSVPKREFELDAESETEEVKMMKLVASDNKLTSQCSVHLLKIEDSWIRMAASSAKKAEKAILAMEDRFLNKRKLSNGDGMLELSSEDEIGRFSGKRKPKSERGDVVHGLDSDVSSISDSSEIGKRTTRAQAKNRAKARREQNKRKMKNVSSDVSTESLTDSSSDDDGGSKSTAKKQQGKARKRVKTFSSDSDSQKDVKIKGKKGKGKAPTATEKNSKGRKNIKKVLSENELKEATREAVAAERERRERIAERQKTYNEVCGTFKSSTVKRVVLEIDQKTKRVTVEVHPTLCDFLKPHQVDGIKFMYDCLIESADRLPKDSGSGCILAHAMGLGKTLQVIAFLHTIFTNNLTRQYLKSCLVVCPVNTVRNWANEFKIWLNHNGLLDFMLYEMADAKTIPERGKILREWYRNKGVMVIGMPLFTQFVGGGRGKKPPKWVQSIMEEALVDPGPDLIICDEGHLMKNEKTAFNKACNSVGTNRRVILTGTPLQNNLIEYHVMTEFIKPNLLGTRKEFTNRFVNPIMNGQCSDSTPHDVKVMKKRVHVLHKILDGCVQRMDYRVLSPYLQPKCEYVIHVQLSEKQIELYRYYLRNQCAQTRQSLLRDCSNLRLIWNHPGLLFTSFTRQAQKMDNFVTDESEESECDSDVKIVDDNDEEVKGSTAADDEEVSKKWNTRSRAGNGPQTEEDQKSEAIDECANAWFRPFISPEDVVKIECSGKMILLFSILDKCEKIGDKIIIFSQSLLLLDLIERCLEVRTEENSSKERRDCDVTGIWIKGIDFFRIDGSIESTSRKNQIDKFNDASNLRARLFLVSTKAGSLGINLVGANRCIIFDACWNPTFDIQAIFRIYRFGQTKPVYVYRFIAQGTMEEKIYDRQVIKQSLSCRVIDEQQIERHFKQSEIAELYKFDPDTRSDRPTLALPKDRLLADVIMELRQWFVSYHEHDSLLENQPDEDLTEEERKTAWTEYEEEKDIQLLREQQEEAIRKQREEANRVFQERVRAAYAQQQAQYAQQQTQFAQQQAQFAQQQAQQNAQRSSQAHTQQTRPPPQQGGVRFAQYFTRQQHPQQQQQQQQQHQQRQQPQRPQQQPQSAPNGQPLPQERQKGLPSYDKLTVEDIFDFLTASSGEVNRGDHFVRAMTIITTGINIANNEWKEVTTRSRGRTLTQPEMTKQLKAQRELQNLKQQLQRLKLNGNQIFDSKNSPLNNVPNKLHFGKPVEAAIDEVD